MIQVPQPRLGRILPRHAAHAVTEALTDTRVVLVNGARQCGKSTLVSQIGAEHGAVWRSLDDPVQRQAAHDDPVNFVIEDRMLVVDEIQRDPELLLAIKQSVDADQRPGRFLLTGSSRLLGLRNLPDTLVGRMETIELWPLSQGEIDGAPDGFVDAAFTQGPRLKHISAETRDGYIDRILRGGFPESIARAAKRRSRFFESYLADLVNREVRQIARIEHVPQMETLIQLLAARSGQLLVPSSLASELGISRDTVNNYLCLLEEVFLIKRIPAWLRNITTRATATQKVAMVDSGIAADLLNQDAHALRKPGSPLGALLEGFVTMEIARQLTWSSQRARLFHYRTKDKVEVDIVLENRRREVVAIEVKASSTVRSEDFRGLRHLADRLGDDFIAGFVAYTGPETLAFGPKLRTIPISAIWEVGGSPGIQH